MDILYSYLPTFLLVLLRASIVIALLPVVGSKVLPARLKIGLAVAVALVLTPFLHLPFSQDKIAGTVAREALVGIAIGIAARAVFLAVEMAGQLVSTSMGLSMATIFNPDFGESTEVARFYGLITTLIFLAVDAHHDLISLFVMSYDLLPPDRVDLAKLVPVVMPFFSGLLVITLKIGAPVVVTMFIVNILMGFLTKAAPQMNVFFVAYPVYLAIGFLVLMAGAPAFVYVIQHYIETIRDEIMKMLAALRA